MHKLLLTNKYIGCSHITRSQEHQASQFLICNEYGLVNDIMISQALVDNLDETIKNDGYRFSSPKLEISCLCVIVIKVSNHFLI